MQRKLLEAVSTSVIVTYPSASSTGQRIGTVAVGEEENYCLQESSKSKHIILIYCSVFEGICGV